MRAWLLWSMLIAGVGIGIVGGVLLGLQARIDDATAAVALRCELDGAFEHDGVRWACWPADVPIEE